MIFRILAIHNTIKEVKENPGHFAGSKARDAIIGILLVPVMIVVLGLVFLFALGFLHFLGGPYLFFKVIFILGLCVSLFAGLIIYKLTSVIRRTTKKVVNTTVEHIRNQ